jgi:hypothetical protein
MASIREYHERLSTTIAAMPIAVTPEGVAFLEGYQTALEDLKMTWLTSPLWHTEVTRNDLPFQVDRIREALEQRLAREPATIGAPEDNGAAEERVLTAGAAGASGGVRQEGGP